MPKLRFPEFTGDWTKGNIGESGIQIIDGDRGANYPRSEDFSSQGDCLFLSAKNVTKTGFVFKETSFISASKDAAMSKGKLRRGDIVLTTRGSLGHIALFSDAVEYNDIRINSGMVLLRTTTELETSFIYQQLVSGMFQREVERISFGSAQPQLTVKSIKKMPVSVCSISEQRKIAEFLGAVDTKIAQLAEKKRLLEDYKKGCMQQLFSQKIRFKDEAGNDFPDWEEKRLGAVATKTASSISANSLETSPGEYPVYGASGIAGYVDYFSSDDYHIGVVKDGAGVGRLHFCPPKSSVLGTLESVKASGENSTKFVFYWMSQINFAAYSTGSTIPHVYFKDYGKKRGRFPHPDEQRKIADFLSALDRKIDLVAQELEHAQKFKKGLLQQMFV